MSYVVLDTDVASLSFRGRVPSVLLARLAGAPTCITFVTLTEMTQWAVQRQWGLANRERLTRWLSGVVVLPGSEAVARVWVKFQPMPGFVVAHAHRMTRGLPPPASFTSSHSRR